MKKVYDAFISHASEDKRYFVRALANRLSEYGANIWYDEFTLRAGISLSRTIEKGILDSKYGIVVLSKAFFEKNWTEYELRALNSIEINNPNTIIPVWYKVKHDEVRAFSPYLADKLAITTDSNSIDNVAVKILEAIRQDLFEELHEKQAWNEMLKNSKVKEVNASEVKIGPVRHQELPVNLITRIRLIRIALFEVYPHSMEYWLDGFRRDLHPEDEVNKWELISTCYSESVQVIKNETLDERKEVFKVVLVFLHGDNITISECEHLTENQLNVAKEICKYIVPVYDIKDKKFGSV